MKQLSHAQRLPRRSAGAADSEDGDIEVDLGNLEVEEAEEQMDGGAMKIEIERTMRNNELKEQ